MALGVPEASRSRAVAWGGELRPDGAVHLNPVFVPATAHSATQGRSCSLGQGTWLSSEDLLRKASLEFS